MNPGSAARRPRAATAFWQQTCNESIVQCKRFGCVIEAIRSCEPDGDAIFEGLKVQCQGGVQGGGGQGPSDPTSILL